MPPRRARSRRAGTAAALLLLTLVAVTTVAGCAQADPALVTAAPADGAALAVGPQQVDLTFDRPLDVAQSHIGVVDGASASLDRGELTSAGPRTLRQPVRAAGEGTVVVGYHVVFDDGTDMSGSVRFSVGTGEAPAGAAQAAASEHGHGVDPFGAALLVVDLAVLVGVLVMLRRRPRRGAEDGPA